MTECGLKEVTSRRAKQSQFRTSRQQRVSAGVLRNKANCHGTGSRRPGGRLCETKPTAEAVRRTQVPVTKGVRRDSGEFRPCENKANFGRKASAVRQQGADSRVPERAKQRLFQGESLGTAEGRARGHSCETKPICGRPGRAKQSQLASSGHGPPYEGIGGASPTLQVWVPASARMTYRDQRLSAFICGC